MLQFPKANRILKRIDYLKFFQHSDVKRLGPCVVFRRENTLGYARLGLTIKSKSGSVFRNHVKRQVREIFRLNHYRMGSFDYNVVYSFNPKSGYKEDYRSPERVRIALEKIWAHEVVF